MTAFFTDLWAKVKSNFINATALLGTVFGSTMAHIDEIAAAEAAPLGLTEPQCRDYLSRNLNFHFRPREKEGLDLYLREAAELELVHAELCA